jgi:hypothetical protein
MSLSEFSHAPGRIAGAIDRANKRGGRLVRRAVALDGSATQSDLGTPAKLAPAP